MNVQILIYQSPGALPNPLEQAFRAEAPDSWRVEIVHSAEALIALVADPPQHCLAIVHDELAPDAEEGGPGESGLDLVGQLHRAAEEVAVVVVSRQGNVDRAARAIEAGAVDFLVLGENLRQRIATLLGKLRKLFEVIDRKRLLDQHNTQLRETIQAKLRIVGRSPQIRALLEKVRRVAKVPRPVLIVGERGTGKELVARAIHFAADTSTRPIVTINCAAFNDTLLESELFGHERGAFTGADATRYGKFEQADGGTLFLDEIANMSLPFQEKILRVVEYGTYSRVGGTTELKTEARVIAATNRDLQARIRAGRFLPDLYDRLAFETIEVPPLRVREGDVEVLADYFLDQFALETPAFDGKTLSRAGLDVLRAYRFPGNVRELKNLIERAAYRDTTNEITPEDIGLPSSADPAGYHGTFDEKLHAFGRRLIADAMTHSHGNQAQAARTLGLSYHQFRYYRKKYEVP